MNIPHYVSFIVPLLEVISDGPEHRLRDVVGLLADRPLPNLVYHHPRIVS